ncbi:DNA helicase HerA-like ATPase [Tardiphaga robiniae]|uniref:ATP-binding protein n=1 Tax=Tardiphaga robiniae TaxID=943830 RepID=UPI00285CD8CA|nr:ATP-binding protein [Tardiphaga robiniae]MDR6658501.1 DNA helicase HerA-like ATPase [Tardiphaga robiniae]
MPDNHATQAVLRIGQVTEVSGRRVFVRVDRNKNVSDFFFDGQLLRNTSVNGYIEIRKGFLTLIGKVEGEKVDEELRVGTRVDYDANRRVLTVALVGFVGRDGKFFGGTRELPLIGNEASLVTSSRIHQIHQLISEGDISVSFAKTDYEDYPMNFPVDGLFNSHIAIFGNTGSGKSNTLAAILGSFTAALQGRNKEAYLENCRFLLFDFNGEYIHQECITSDKKVFNLSTRDATSDKIPIPRETLLDLELVAILSDATEKTQKPFLRRAISLFSHVWGDGQGDYNEHFRNILRQRITSILQMSDKVRVDLLFDYLRELLPETAEDGSPAELAADIEWHNLSQEYKIKGGAFLKSSPERIPETFVYEHVQTFQLSDNLLTNLISFMYLQLIGDVLSNRAQNEHIAPVINKLKSKRPDIEKLFNAVEGGDLWGESNFVVINLHDVNIEMKKTLPLLIAKREYQNQKYRGANASLSIIIDEAHNILSSQSSREAESWKDYRLETFEEIIKEGRKFGVFVTIASQRPNDISATITSQAHNYFIHRLVNQKDLATIANAVSYIDQLSEASIPSLPTGTCIFSGTAGQMPLKLVIDKLEGNTRPQSGTLEFSKSVPLPVLKRRSFGFPFGKSRRPQRDDKRSS